MTKRVVRIGPEITLSHLEMHGSAAAIASEKIDLLSRPVRSVKIGPPRASQLFEDCMRKRVLAVKTNAMRPEFDSLGSRMVFGIGNAIHDWAQNTDELFGDSRRGWWKCRACHYRYFGKPPKRACPRCKAHYEAFKYDEHSIHIQSPVEVTGHVDMFFEHSPNVVRVAELKSINGEEFEKLKAAYAPHEWQIQTYMFTSEFDHSLPVDIDRGVGYVIYISKKAQAREFPIKMFPIVRNAAIVDAIREKLTSYMEGFEDFPNNLPAIACRDFSSYTARFCPVVNECRRFE